MPTIFLVNGVSSFPDPGDWNPTNTVECVGAGGVGSVKYTGGPELLDSIEGEPPPTVSLLKVGNAGGGGAYAKGTNINPTFPVGIAIAQYGSYGSQNYTGTSFGGSGPSDSTNALVWAADGTSGAGMNSGGYGGTVVKPTGFAGANGAIVMGQVGNGGGGGGSGGPRGAGGAGSGTNGGTGDGGNVAGTTAGQAGNKSTYWDSTHGTGGGGGGGTTANVNGGGGGLYGGGGGSQADSGTSVNGAGTSGLIVIIYTPYFPVVTAQSFVVV